MKPFTIDNFAGGGGASTGIEAAIDGSIDVAINHDDEAIAMHMANHPETLHYCQSILSKDPLEVVEELIARHGGDLDAAALHLGYLIWLIWFSPDCKHHSKAKGGKPREKNIRDLAWVVVHWIERLQDALARKGIDPRRVIKSIMLENVEEFRKWGPLDANGMPIKDREGEEFDLFVRRIKRRGGKVEFRELLACDYGAPTARKRLYMIVRFDGQPIVWPQPTHRPANDNDFARWSRDLVKRGFAKPSPDLPHYRTAAECIDWSITCPSIFDRKRPLKEATNRRIAHGVMRYVVNAASPFIVGTAFTSANGARYFDPKEPLRTATSQREYGVVDAGIVPLTHHGGFGRVYSSADPIVTITGAHRGELATIGAAVVPITHTSGRNVAHGVCQPLRTITTAKGGELAGVTVTLAPHITKFRGGAIGAPADGPMPTITANGNPKRPAGAQPLAYAHAVLAPVIVGCGGRRGQSGPVDVTKPYPTTTAKADACLVTATMIQAGYGEREGQIPRALNICAPLGTVVAGGIKHSLVTAHLEKFSENSRGKSLGSPLDTVMAGAPRHGLVTTFLSHFYSSNTNGGQGDPRQPAKTITSEGQHHAVVAAHMEQANTGMVGHDARKPLSTIVGKGCTQRIVETTMIDRDALPPEQLDRALRVAAFLIKYYGNEDGGHGLDRPIGTVTTLDRFAVVTVTIDAVTYVIVDIGMRMLTPRELANAQGFPPSYVLDPIGPNGKPLSKSAQIRMIGNSVCPDVAEALVRANLPELCRGSGAATESQAVAA
ncbi:DNA cytosine methyltransferase [Sphingomonas koreensis]|uniref:DNA cytosine methyltransferase n=1 Tax=Sphingomonas koreensis TaxID=93064 RepID=UPI000F7EAD1E|nr:DNA cytosine methyltransferase [Sphingomonas koreensis]RSU21230.1 C-5 cytosine-specific DNA methylase [Sphingomonas koreensis]RSU32205.1 C-5 cytosine-specific DNA methylase [Sphingomonas koreensis]RSU35699.1 C-5 cytosine-specific DNA methylase [Sphingomonas koreensis]RSU49870.1 C-5 cytosine-specific DNA methylase [Sphingomonas koreensis]RSU83465.1 C-5 cytosine-specific DNA methylase [Sphingomonas koreensis]